jgi:hypothetical protein
MGIWEYIKSILLYCQVLFFIPEPSVIIFESIGAEAHERCDYKPKRLFLKASPIRLYLPFPPDRLCVACVVRLMHDEELLYTLWQVLSYLNPAVGIAVPERGEDFLFGDVGYHLHGLDDGPRNYIVLEGDKIYPYMCRIHYFVTRDNSIRRISVNVSSK